MYVKFPEGSDPLYQLANLDWPRLKYVDLCERGDIFGSMHSDLLSKMNLEQCCFRRGCRGRTECDLRANKGPIWTNNKDRFVPPYVAQKRSRDDQQQAARDSGKRQINEAAATVYCSEHFEGKCQVLPCPYSKKHKPTKYTTIRIVCCSARTPATPCSKLTGCIFKNHRNLSAP